ncbi:1471_t:CDS:2 [Acaulospora morrowiae]|uniref:1471_t:CDS:1 n=1 Tax=Acaulospora morrowiae TaxID=94023 RepID=A0A9N8ZVI9_9GLOM|nr:1471_t:CDS:2 [Acaulospora morrowiae]
MSYQNPATFSPYTLPPDEQKAKTARNSIRYAHVPSASTSASTSANPFGVYQTTEQLPDGQIKVNKYETNLPIRPTIKHSSRRVDIEAAMTYCLGSITGVLFLIVEQKNDYVRFHAWQSSIFFAVIFVNIVLLGKSYRAYLDGATLERFELPFFGKLASSWVDNE